MAAHMSTHACTYVYPHACTHVHPHGDTHAAYIGMACMVMACIVMAPIEKAVAPIAEGVPVTAEMTFCLIQKMQQDRQSRPSQKARKLLQS